MRIAFISDLHANFTALEAMASELADVDLTVCLGDLLGYYCDVRETLDWVREHVDVCLRGNHDHYILHNVPSTAPPAVVFGVEFARRRLTPGDRAWLESLSPRWQGELDGINCLLVHGSPKDPLSGYLYPDSIEIDESLQLDFDLVAFGQTHRYVHRQSHRSQALNPGSIGQSRDPATRGQACAAVLDTQTGTIERLIQPFSVDRVLDLARRHGAGPWITKHLLA